MIDLIKFCYFLLVSHMADIVTLYSMADIVVVLYKIDTVVLYINTPYSQHPPPPPLMQPNPKLGFVMDAYCNCKHHISIL